MASKVDGQDGSGTRGDPASHLGRVDIHGVGGDIREDRGRSLIDDTVRRSAKGQRGGNGFHAGTQACRESRPVQGRRTRTETDGMPRSHGGREGVLELPNRGAGGDPVGAENPDYGFDVVVVDVLVAVGKETAPDRWPSVDRQVGHGLRHVHQAPQFSNGEPLLIGVAREREIHGEVLALHAAGLSPPGHFGVDHEHVLEGHGMASLVL